MNATMLHLVCVIEIGKNWLITARMWSGSLQDSCRKGSG